MKDSKNILTGITPSGTPHLGNYIGAIKPAINLSQNQNYNPNYFIADFHSLIKLKDATARKKFTLKIACTWLALGLNPEKVTFYKQSDVPEIMTLNWILSTVTAKGLLNRSHAYKSYVDNNIADGLDTDTSISMGLFNYPVLMAADIIMFNTDLVPVGKDQIQHVEIARDIANRFNHVYKTNILHIPEAVVGQDNNTIIGLDGRKMSKSYNNTIPLFENEKKLRKSIMKIKTNSQLPEEKKSTENCNLFSLYILFSTEEEQSIVKQQYEAGGLGWGAMKEILFQKINSELKGPRELYDYYMENPDKVEMILKKGAEKARLVAKPLLNEIKILTGLN